MSNLINMDVYEVKGIRSVKIKRSWDDTYYMEIPDHHPGGFGFPVPGIDLDFKINNNCTMVRCSGYGNGGRIILRPHNVIKLAPKVAKLLIEANGKKQKPVLADLEDELRGPVYL